jgi:hypothetical protein
MAPPRRHGARRRARLVPVLLLVLAVVTGWMLWRGFQPACSQWRDLCWTLRVRLLRGFDDTDALFT